MLLQMNFRVVAPDMMGYGKTVCQSVLSKGYIFDAVVSQEAPHVPPASISLYSFKRVADDIKELARQLGVSQIILGGHDWGGVIVYRIALWYPELVSHLFCICTPYRPPFKDFTPLEDIIKSGKLPNFGYQLQLASGQLEGAIQSRDQIRLLLNSIYGGRTSSGEPGVDVKNGVYLDRLPQLQDTPLVSKEMLDYYADEYARNGIHGTRKSIDSIVGGAALIVCTRSELVQDPKAEFRR